MTAVFEIRLTSVVESYKQTTPLANLQKEMPQLSCLVILSNFFAWLIFPTSHLKQIHVTTRSVHRTYGFFSVAVA